MTSVLEAMPPSAAQALGADALVLAAPRLSRCRCGRPIFFRNSRCLACGTPIGYLPGRPGAMLALERAEPTQAWRACGSHPARAGLYWRCANFESAAGCNWLVEGRADAPPARPLCRSCGLNRVLPDTSSKQHRLWWRRIEVAKRRLVASLLGLGLPLRSKVDEDARRGLAFDLLHEDEQHPRVLTGYARGIVTVNIEEADDAKRERVRAALHQPFLTLLGHLRHEVGHYYRERLVMGSDWQAGFRTLFGDERQPAPEATPQHAEQGHNGEWASRYVSAFAALHPTVDWAETFAHYVHMIDTMATASSLGIDAEFVELRYEPFTESSLYRNEDGEEAHAFLAFVNDWMELTGVLNELSRSMGWRDFYPFVLSTDALRKLHFVHLVVAEAARTEAPYQRTSPIGGGITGGSRTGTGLSIGDGS